LTFGLAVHQFLSPVAIKDATKTLPSNLGQELDMDFGLTINKFAKLNGGYSFYLNTPSLLFLKGVKQSADAQHWAWLALNINPKLFSLKY